MTRCHSFLRRFAEDRHGTALIDFAFAVPILVLILMGCFEATRYILLHQKLDRAASATADLVAQLDDPVTAAQVNDLFDAAAHLMEPFDLGANGRVIVSSVYREDSDPAEVTWQRMSPGATSATSEVGAQDSAASMPSGFTVNTGDNVIVAETFYDYTPFFLDFLFPPRQLYHNAYNRPRNGDLDTAPSP